jgi:hypothetical protein
MRSASMISETIQSIEERIKNTDSIKYKEKQELLNLLSTLEAEVTALAKTHPEQAQSITGFTQLSTHEATRTHKDQQLIDVSLKGLTSSIEGFENSHENLVKIVNSIALMLSNVGI